MYVTALRCVDWCAASWALGLREVRVFAAARWRQDLELPGRDWVLGCEDKGGICCRCDLVCASPVRDACTVLAGILEIDIRRDEI